MQAKLVKNNLESIEISSAEWYSLNQFLYEIKQIDSPCVSVYYPYGKGTETISLLQETKRKESFEIIESEIEKRITHLRKSPSSAGKFAKTLSVPSRLLQCKQLAQRVRRGALIYVLNRLHTRVGYS